LIVDGCRLHDVLYRVGELGDDSGFTAFTPTPNTDALQA
jgi:hypothetical protein